MTHLLANFMKRFLSHYLPVQKGLSANTIAAYRDAIKLLLCYAADTVRRPLDKLAVEDMTEKVVLGFLDYVQQRRSCSPTTRNARLAAIHSLFAFIAREQPELLAQCQKIRSIPLKRTEHKSVDYLEENEMQAMLDSIQSNSRTAIRDQALLLLLYNTGARVSEIVELKLSNLRLDGTPQVELLGKGRKHRACPLWPETLSALQAYLNKRTPKQPSTERLFLNTNGVPITRFGIRHITDKYATAAQHRCPSIKTKTVSPHTLRHTTAMHLLRSGNDVNMVSYWLGHVDINTTHIYLEIDLEMKRKMLEKADPPAINNQPAWHKPDVLQWLSALGKAPELCAVNRQKMKDNPRSNELNFT
jgi:site-specific recombinase XerD